MEEVQNRLFVLGQEPPQAELHALPPRQLPSYCHQLQLRLPPEHQKFVGPRRRQSIQRVAASERLFRRKAVSRCRHRICWPGLEVKVGPE